MSTRRIFSCILLPAYLSSCVTNWEVQRASPEQFIEEEQPSQVRVATTDRSEIILEQPRVSGDTLFGFGERKFSWAGSVYAAADTGTVLEIPLADISHVAVKKTNAGESILIGVGVVGVALMVTMVAVLVDAGYRLQP